MSFTYLKKLPTPAEIRARYPLSEQGRAVKQARDKAITDVITGRPVLGQVPCHHRPLLGRQ